MGRNLEKHRDSDRSFDRAVANVPPHPNEKWDHDPERNATACHGNNKGGENLKVTTS